MRSREDWPAKPVVQGLFRDPVAGGRRGPWTSKCLGRHGVALLAILSLSNALVGLVNVRRAGVARIENAR